MQQHRYQEISDILAEELADLAHGTRVPSENELAARFEVSRATARSVLGELESRLVVRRVRGSGTFVNHRLDYVISRAVPPSWQQTIERSGQVPTRILVDSRIVNADAALATELQIEVGDEVTRLTTTNYINDLLSAHGTTFVPKSVAPDLVSTARVYDSIDSLLRESWELTPVSAQCRVSFDPPPDGIRETLDMNRRNLAWHVTRVTRDGEAGRVIMASDSWFRPDALNLIVEL